MKAFNSHRFFDRAFKNGNAFQASRSNHNLVEASRPNQRRTSLACKLLKPQFLLVEALHRLFEGTSEEAEQLVQGILERCQALVFLAEVSSTFFSSSDHPPLYWAASVMRHSLPNLLPPAAARFQHPLHSKTWL